MKAQGCFCVDGSESAICRLPRSSCDCIEGAPEDADKICPPEDPSRLIIPIRPILQGRDPDGSGAVMSYFHILP